MKKRIFHITVIIFVSLVEKSHSKNRILVCGVINEYSAEYDVMRLGINDSSTYSNTSIILKPINATGKINPLNRAVEFLQQNIIALIEGSHTKISVCALAKVTGMPLIRLHGNNHAFDQCGKLIQMSAGYKDYAHAILDILNTFQWKKIALVFDEGRLRDVGYFYTISLSSKFTLNFIQLANKREANELHKASVLSAVEKIANLGPEVILLYTTKEKTELLLTQPVRWIAYFSFPSPSFT